MAGRKRRISSAQRTISARHNCEPTSPNPKSRRLAISPSPPRPARTIDATIKSFAVALSAGIIAAAASETGAAATNVLGTQVQGYINDSTVTTGDDITVLAWDNSTINAEVGAAAIAAAAGWWSGTAASLAASEATSIIANAVEASILNSDVSAGSDTEDELRVEAIDRVIVKTKAVAASEAGSTGLFGKSTAYGAALATAEVGTDTRPHSTRAHIDQSTALAGGNLTVRANSVLDMDVAVGTGAEYGACRRWFSGHGSRNADD